MSALNKRELLLVLTALLAGGAAPAMAQSTIDLTAGRVIGDGYRAANPGLDLEALRTSLLPNGLHDALPQLRALVSNDFRNSRVFAHNGWRLSETEAQLFTLLT